MYFGSGNRGRRSALGRASTLARTLCDVLFNYAKITKQCTYLKCMRRSSTLMPSSCGRSTARIRVEKPHGIQPANKRAALRRCVNSPRHNYIPHPPPLPPPPQPPYHGSSKSSFTHSAHLSKEAPYRLLPTGTPGYESPSPQKSANLIT